MIPVRPAPEPPTFDAMVRQPGTRALSELVGAPTAGRRVGRPRGVVAARVEEVPGGDLPPYWTRALPDLLRAYGSICAYLAMEIPAGTGEASVDHFQPKSRHQSAAYDWENYRLACLQANRNKGDHEDVIDPFLVHDGWFELVLMTGEVQPASGLDLEVTSRIQATIQRLRLNDTTLVARRRVVVDELLGLARTADGHPLPPLPWEYVQRTHPHVHRELQRQGVLDSA